MSTKGHQVVVDDAIKSISHIATLPEVTLRIIELVEDPSSTAQDLHKVISNDPALCSRILKVVNSAFYGLPRQIGSINRAIVLLGLNAVKNISIAASLAKMFRGGQLCPQFSARDLWTHSIAAATCSKLISDELKLGLPDEAFLAGLIHDIGVMVEMQADRQKLIQVFESLQYDDDGTPTTDMREMETQIFGANHEQFGAGLCEAWKFPTSFGFVAGHHHDPSELSSASRTLANVVQIADRICGEQGFGFRADLTTCEIPAAAREEVGLSLDSIEGIRRTLAKAIEDVEATFGGGDA